jgi:hypothetical protein
MKKDSLTGRIITNECGDCSACCTTHGIQAIQKQPKQTCPHCTAGNGCAIYNDRPEDCHDFNCAWLVGLGGGPHRRPDKLGVVVQLGATSIFSEYRAGALNSEPIFKWTRKILLIGRRVLHHPIEGNSRMYLPRGAKFPVGQTIQCISFDEAIRGLVL